MSLRQEAAQMSYPGRKEIINDDFADRIHALSVNLPDDTTLNDLRFRKYYPIGSPKLKAVFKPSLLGWIQGFIGLSRDEKRELEVCLRACGADRRDLTITLGQLRDADLGFLMEKRAIGPLRAQFIKKAFRRG